MAVTLLFLNQHTSIVGVETLTLDASLSETHTSKNTVTTRPVEQGVKITDHKLREPDGVVVKGVITNDPMPVGGAQSRSDNTRVGNAYQALLALLDSPNLLAVNTNLRSYSNMVMTDLSIPRDATSGQSIEFTATFTEIRIVFNQTVQVTAKTTKALKPVDKHKLITPPTNVRSKSFLKSRTDSGIGAHPLQSLGSALGGIIPGT